jgi:hypothetical protein
MNRSKLTSDAASAVSDFGYKLSMKVTALSRNLYPTALPTKTLNAQADAASL